MECDQWLFMETMNFFRVFTSTMTKDTYKLWKPLKFNKIEIFYHPTEPLSISAKIISNGIVAYRRALKREARKERKKAHHKRRERKKEEKTGLKKKKMPTNN